MHIIYVVNLPLHLMFYIFFRRQKKDTAPKKQQPGGEKSNTEATRRSDIQAPQKQKRNLQTHIENKKKDKCANKKQKSSRDTRR